MTPSTRAALYAPLFFAFSTLAAAPPAPPGPPSSGYGSTAQYVAQTWSETSTGLGRLGTRVWTYVPDTLAGGDHAPVVVFLHGWTAYLPAYYEAWIEHLVRQGFIVIYPQYQKAGVVGLFTDSDQTAFLDRAIEAVDKCLVELGDVADRHKLVVAGHSLGGLLAWSWNGAGGAPAEAVLLINASLTSDEVPDEVPLIKIDWESYAEDIQVPIVFLTGDQDGLAPDSLLGHDAAVNAPSREVYMAVTDTHGEPPIRATHGAPVVPAGDADTLDTRYYFSALDAMLRGETTPSFDMGRWSDGVSVAPIQVLTP